MHREILEDQGLQAGFRIAGPCFSRLRLRIDNDGTASLAPIRIFPSQHLQGSIPGVVIPVDDPYRSLLCHLLIHHHFLYMAGTIIFNNQPVTDIRRCTILRIKCDDRHLFTIPFIRKRPVYLNIRICKHLQKTVWIHRQGLCCGHRPHLLFNQFPQRFLVSLP